MDKLTKCETSATRLIGYSALRKSNPQPALIISLITLEKDPGTDVLRSVVIERLMQMPRFRSRLVIEKMPLEWEETEVDPKYHVEVLGAGRKVSNDEIREFVASTKDRPLDWNRPLWKVTHVPEMEDGTSKVVIVINHAIGDGIALVSALLFKIVDEAKELAQMQDNVKKRSGAPKLPLMTKIGSYLYGTYQGHFGNFGAQDKKNPLKLIGPPGPTKTLANSPKIELAKVKQIAKAVGEGVTVNDVLMAIMTKAMAYYFRDIAKEDPRIIKSRRVRAQFPVDARKKRPAAKDFEDTSNNFAFAFFAMPMGDFEKSRELILKVKYRIDKIKYSPQP